MTVRVQRILVGLLLGASGVLMYAASWQRWSGACRWNQSGGPRCSGRQDDMFEFLPVGAPWAPIGNAAQLAGWSVLVLALAFVFLPWALTGRRPGPFIVAVQLGAVLVQAAVGVATLRSGLTGTIVEPIFGDTMIGLWYFVPFGVLVAFALFCARSSTLVAAVLCLILATPIVAVLSYYHGPFDARPWYEAISAIFTVAAGVLLLIAAFFNRPWKVTTA